MSEQSLSWSREGTKLLREEWKIRLVLTLVLLLFVATGGDAITDMTPVVLAAVLLVGSLLISRFAAKTERGSGPQSFQVSTVALVVLDLMAVTLLLNGTGGLHSGFFLFYLVSLIFAAAFFRGLELALLTALVVLLYIGVCIHYIDSNATLWQMSAHLIGMIVVAWYSYALSGVLHREKENNDQLLRHLTEGVMLFDRDQKVTLVNATMLQMIGEVPDQDIVGHTRAELAGRDKVLSWLLGDVGMGGKSYKTRVGCFPEADLPMVECTTIPCMSDIDMGGWVVVCKDLRDLNIDLKSARQSCDKLAPLTNLHALSEALYGMAGYLEEERRWDVIETIESHTLALQSILADMLHQGGAESDTSLELDFIDISSLLSSTRRLLEVQFSGEHLEIEIFCQEGLPEINADRTLLGQCLLQVCKGLIALGSGREKLVIDARNADRKVIFSLQLASKVPAAEEAEPLDAAQLQRFEELCDASVLKIVEAHQGHWECRPDSETGPRVVFDLPISGPANVDEQAISDGKRVRVPHAGGMALPLEPSLAAEITNQLKNTLSVIRGYAEMALDDSSPERQRDALGYAMSLSDQASDLVQTLQPATGEFDLEVKVPDDQETDAVIERPRTPSAEGSILVVDDDPSMRRLLVDVLVSAGYATIEANDGREGVEAIRLSQPILAFVDLSMPRVTGIEVMREARKYAPSLPVVLMTGYATQVAIEAVGDQKPYSILSKPFAISDVLSLAKAVLGEQKSQAG